MTWSSPTDGRVPRSVYSFHSIQRAADLPHYRIIGCRRIRLSDCITRYALGIYLGPATHSESSPCVSGLPNVPCDQQVSINRFFGQGLAISISFVSAKSCELTGPPSCDVGIGVHLYVAFDVIFGRHVWWIASQGAGTVTSLVDTNIVDPKVVGKVHVSPVDKLEVIGLRLSIHIRGEMWTIEGLDGLPRAD